MSEDERSIDHISAFLPKEVEGFNDLAEFALNMRWSWNHSADDIWRNIDPLLWDLTHNPWVVLQTVSREQLEKAMSDPVLRNKIDELIRIKQESAESAAWFQKTYPGSPLKCIAYFSMEFMLSEALPIYSGGLGNVAGDQLKAASDLGVPVIGVGLLYQQGYFRQVIDQNGIQQELYPYNDPGQLPITPLREPSGEWVRIELEFPGYSVWLRVWQVQVGRVKLYLLDSNDLANFPAHRGITSELYGGGPELRLMQEIVLGIGGWRILGLAGVKPDVCHLNEGHAAFAVLERARGMMLETGQSFEAALTAARAGNIFTTHTPVAAGFDRFSPLLIEKYLGRYAVNMLKISTWDLMSLGRQNPDDPKEPFNMAYLALRGSMAVNGVSRLHGRVSRKIFQPLFQKWPEAEVPVGHVTNGVHMATWDSEEADELWTEACGKGRWLGTVEAFEEQIRRIPDARFWKCRESERASLLAYVRERFSRQLAVSGASNGEVEEAKHIFDEKTLTLGFARRFATYKRPNLLLHDPERLLHILTNPERPVQLILAGKAHPADQEGQAMIQQWMQFISRPEARRHVVFLSDYDMLLTEQLVQGVDVWINTPRRPWEASGTSGMKVLVNGGINLSELDGWWAEAYTPEVGWSLGDGNDHGDDPSWDAAEAEALYQLLEQEVVPGFYTRNKKGIPTQWVSRIRESMARLTPQFSANRTVSEYTEKYYIPAARAYHERIMKNCAKSEGIVNWKHLLDKKWDSIRFGEVKVDTKEQQHIFSVQIDLNGIGPDALLVEMYADGLNGGDPVRQKMVRSKTASGGNQFTVFTAILPATRPATDYTPRVVPYYQGVSVPLEASHILWQK